MSRSKRGPSESCVNVRIVLQDVRGCNGFDVELVVLIASRGDPGHVKPDQTNRSKRIKRIRYVPGLMGRGRITRSSLTKEPNRHSAASA